MQRTQAPTTTKPRFNATQAQEHEWTYQWEKLQSDCGQTEELFWEWLQPLTAGDLRDKKVLDAGCGGGHMLGYIQDLVGEGVGVDLNTAEIVQRRFRDCPHIRIHNGDLASWNAETDFDVVYSIGVVHHTKDPRKSARHLMTLVRPGGKLAIWVYGHEGNFWVRALVEGPKKLYGWMPRGLLWAASCVITAMLYPIIYSVYLLPVSFLPYYEYFRSSRRLSFMRNVVNVFDKLNAPTTHFIRREEIDDWFEGMPFHNLQVTPWNGISWRICAQRNEL